MHETHQQQNHIFYEICKARKIKILMTTNSRSIIKKKRNSSKTINNTIISKHYEYFNNCRAS